MWRTSSARLVEHLLMRLGGVVSAEVLPPSDLLKITYCRATCLSIGLAGGSPSSRTPVTTMPSPAKREHKRKAGRF